MTKDEDGIQYRVVSFGLFVYHVNGVPQRAPDPRGLARIFWAKGYPLEVLALCSEEKAELLETLLGRDFKVTEMVAGGYTMFDGVETEVVEWSR